MFIYTVKFPQPLFAYSKPSPLYGNSSVKNTSGCDGQVSTYVWLYSAY